MALRDVKKYYYDVQGQLIAAKEDLADFNVALESGFITEDKLSAVMDELAQIQINYDRLSYIMYLFELPVNKKKNKKFRASNTDLEQYFEANNATNTAVINENTSMLTSLRAELKKLKKEKNN